MDYFFLEGVVTASADAEQGIVTIASLVASDRRHLIDCGNDVSNGRQGRSASDRIEPAGAPRPTRGFSVFVTPFQPSSLNNLAG